MLTSAVYRSRHGRSTCVALSLFQHTNTHQPFIHVLLGGPLFPRVAREGRVPTRCCHSPRSHTMLAFDPTGPDPNHASCHRTDDVTQAQVESYIALLQEGVAQGKVASVAMIRKVPEQLTALVAELDAGKHAINTMVCGALQ